MKRKIATGMSLALLLVAMFALAQRIEPVEADRVTGAYVWAVDRDSDGWIRADGIDQIGVSWNWAGPGVLVNYELYRDWMLSDQQSGVGLTGVTYTPAGTQQHCGRCNYIRIWYGSILRGITEIYFGLPKPVADFPIRAGASGRWPGGYIILVAGDCGGSLRPQINQACSRIFDDLQLVGYSASRIYYLNAWDTLNWRVDAMTSGTNIWWAITNWAQSRVGPCEPLFLIMFDHGGSDIFCINNPGNLGETLAAPTLDSWLDTLQAATGADTHVWYMACHSGSFINDLSRTGRVIITSCNPTESSYLAPPPYNEYFTQYFWPLIKQHASLKWAFNIGCWFVVLGQHYHPLLDDNGDGVGHGVGTPPGSFFLPHHGDGYVAQNVYIGGSEWVFPWIPYVVEKRCYAWPPPEVVTLWAKVENKTPLTNVRAWMLPPDWVPPPPNDTLTSVPLETYGLADPDHDGNWTVSIPSYNFTNHASGPSSFKFMITADEENDTAIPLWTGVEFTETGQPPPDTASPSVRIDCPTDLSPVDGAITINGTATDDVCLQKVELYINDSLTGVIQEPPVSNAFFGFNLNTSAWLGGPATINLKAYDTSNNTGTQTINVNVNRDIAVTAVAPSKTIVDQGYLMSVNVTVANQGQFTEAFKVVLYANATVIQTDTITLASGSSTVATLTWNTTGFNKGNYPIMAAVKFLPYETDIADNAMDGGTVIVAMVGDVNADGKVDIKDVYKVAQAYGSFPGHPKWNPICDINNDGKVDMKDYYIVCKNYGKVDP